MTAELLTVEQIEALWEEHEFLREDAGGHLHARGCQCFQVRLWMNHRLMFGDTVWSYTEREHGWVYAYDGMFITVMFEGGGISDHTYRQVRRSKVQTPMPEREPWAGRGVPYTAMLLETDMDARLAEFNALTEQRLVDSRGQAEHGRRWCMTCHDTEHAPGCSKYIPPEYHEGYDAAWYKADRLVATGFAADVIMAAGGFWLDELTPEQRVWWRKGAREGFNDRRESDQEDLEAATWD